MADNSGRLSRRYSLSYPYGKFSAIGHVNLPNGTDGPFAAIDQLQWGDQIIIHLDKYEYLYEVREVFQTNPNDLDIIEKDGDYDWITLITCKDYDLSTKSYDLRTVIVAVRTR
ncbi:MAG: sortase [Anaerolineales bacterium]|nr:sortase [Chloroflexota bacterium]MBL6983565.1 sortase [Anaerolineales bacterium]